MDDVMEGLTELNYPMDEAALKASVSELSPDYTKCVEWLTKEIKYLYDLEEHVNAIAAPEDVASFLLELSCFLKELGCVCKSLTEGPVGERLKTTDDRLLLLDFLINELFAARILNSRKPKVPHLSVTVNETPTAAVLQRALSALKIPKVPDNVTVEQVFSKITSQIQNPKSEASKKCISPPLFAGKLSDKQWNVLENLFQLLSEEYHTRRVMLLKRLDVTILSFQWSERMAGRENDISTLYLPKRQSLNPRPAVKLSDLLAARHHLAIIEKTSSSNVRRNTQSKIIKVIIGRVPDRGGRPGDQQPPPPEMPSWGPRVAPPQGGGGGGDRGRGRGGRVQGGWNQGQRGGQGGYGRGGRGRR